jgi:site-specific DNA-methyltransferase (adenine-specific)
MLLHGDCIELIKQVPYVSVDLILQDPPYGCTKCEWDEDIIPLLPLLWQEWKRVLKPGGSVVMTASQPFSSKLVLSNLEMFKYSWVWDKHIPRGFQVAKYRPMMRHEDVLVFSLGKAKYRPIKVLRDKPVTVKNYSKRKSSNDIGKYNDGRSFTYTHKSPDSIITGCWEANKGKVHPTQKPVSLMEYLVQTYTDPGDTVLDCYMGSGTTGVACKRLGRVFIGFERDKSYFDLAMQRVSNA